MEAEYTMSFAGRIQKTAEKIKQQKAVSDFLSMLGVNRFLFFALGYSLLLQFAQCVAAYLCKSNGSLINPFIHGLWGWLAIFGLCLLPGGKITKGLLGVLLAFQTFESIVRIFLSMKFALSLRADAFLVLAVSSPSEVAEFHESFFTWDAALLVILLLAGLLCTLVLLRKAPLKCSRHLIFLGLLCLVPQAADAVRLAARGDYADIYNRNSLGNLIESYCMAQGEMQYLQAMAKNPVLPSGIRRLTQEQKFLGVIVIGESATRFHHSIYGYPRPTTPELNRHAAAGNLLVYQDVISGYAHTVQALRYLLTTEDKAHPNDFRHTLFHIYKAAGFRIIYISNQARWGKHDTPVSLITAGADKKLYIQEKQAGAFDEACFEVLPDMIKDQDAPVLLVLHLMGSHSTYDDRTPESGKVFTEADRPASPYPRIDRVRLFDEYDNSIRYTDSLLGKAMDQLTALPYPAFLIYTSDHGECPDLAKSRPRAGNSVNADCYEVPFVFYTNAAYRKSFPEFIKAAAGNQAKPFSADMGTYPLISAGQITFDGFPYGNDLFAPGFVPHSKRTLGISDVPYIPRSNPYQKKKQ